MEQARGARIVRFIRESQMERDSFIFYKSFYDAICNLTKDIRLEVLTAIIEYALFGRQPENLKPFAKGMFTLMKPNIDANTVRFENGRKGGRKSGSKKPSAPVETVAPYSLTYEQEVERMKADEKWRESVCKDYNISVEEYENRLARFLERCNDDKARKGKQCHNSYMDCQSHLRYWMTKAFTRKTEPKETSGNEPLPSASDYSFTDGFGSKDI